MDDQIAECIRKLDNLAQLECPSQPSTRYEIEVRSYTASVDANGSILLTEEQKPSQNDLESWQTFDQAQREIKPSHDCAMVKELQRIADEAKHEVERAYKAFHESQARAELLEQKLIKMRILDSKVRKFSML